MSPILVVANCRTCGVPAEVWVGVDGPVGPELHGACWEHADGVLEGVRAESVARAQARHPSDHQPHLTLVKGTS